VGGGGGVGYLRWGGACGLLGALGGVFLVGCVFGFGWRGGGSGVSFAFPFFPLVEMASTSPPSLLAETGLLTPVFFPRGSI